MLLPFRASCVVFFMPENNSILPHGIYKIRTFLCSYKQLPYLDFLIKWSQLLRDRRESDLGDFFLSIPCEINKKKIPPGIIML